MLSLNQLMPDGLAAYQKYEQKPVRPLADPFQICANLRPKKDGRPVNISYIDIEMSSVLFQQAFDRYV